MIYDRFIYIYGGDVINKLFKLSSIFLIAIILSSCSLNKHDVETINTTRQVSNIKNTVTLSTKDIKETVNILCSDDFQGRLTGSDGNKKAEEYLVNIYKNIGLSPLFNNSYYEKYYQEIIPAYGESTNKTITGAVNNIVGVIKGTDSNNAVVISAHFDHIGYVNGKIIRGALDNASGTSAIIEIAKVLKEESSKKAFNMDIIICAFNGEEEGLQGSRAFLQDVESLYKSIYNVNIDSIGAKEGGELTLKNKSKISSNLYAAVKTTIKNDNIKFSESSVEGATDSNSFQYENIPSITLVEKNIKNLVHRPIDTPEILDYSKIKIISDCICDFVQENDGMIFK